MTAVEWLAEKYNEVNWLRNRDEISSKYADELREVYLYKAKEMEKEQIENAFFECWKANMPEGFECKLSAKEYYNKTYNK